MCVAYRAIFRLMNISLRWLRVIIFTYYDPHIPKGSCWANKDRAHRVTTIPLMVLITIVLVHFPLCYEI